MLSGLDRPVVPAQITHNGEKETYRDKDACELDRKGETDENEASAHSHGQEG